MPQERTLTWTELGGDCDGDQKQVANHSDLVIRDTSLIEQKSEVRKAESVGFRFV